jgi:hypothetical protein
MKKFYLTCEQRKRIVNCLLGDANHLRGKLKDVQGSQVATETLEAAIQECQMLADLLKVEEMESD